jgi:hypothetical protein
MRHVLPITICLLVFPIGWCGGADAPSEKALEILERRCVSCHDAAGKKGGLSLVTRRELLAGGESGQLVVPGKPAESLLFDYVTGDKPLMPKSGPPLTAEEIAALRAWIAEDAAWPVERVLEDKSLADTNWWSLKPLVRPKIPPIQNPKSPIQNPIDAFIVAKLDEFGLAQSPEADRRTLIRRLYFDLIGLPPTPAQVEAFMAQDDPRAYERLVDELLASPHYGERWARHWLDVVHFGETHGYDKDKLRPNAWPYRDYVIRALNSDKSYSRFIEEQIAGDVLYPETADGIEALGFISAGPWDFIGHAELPETKIDGKVARHLDRDDMVQNTTGTFLSLTVGCAQCHNHKFDPITQREYYQLQAVFAALDRNDKPYDRDPAIANRRRDLTTELSRLNAERTRINGLVSERGGEPLAELDRRLAELAKSATGQKRPEFGYHSAIETQEDTIKWVQVDLGKPQQIAAIEYVACHDDFNGIGAGFGFPLRYKIEASNDAAFREGVRVLVDRTESDVQNPGVVPQRVDSLDETARYVRITTTKLAPRLPTDFIFALGELAVFGADGKNLAAGQPVTSLDSIEAPVRWQRANLVDGYYYGQASGAAAEIARVQQEREELVACAVDEKTRRELSDVTAAIAKAEADLESLPAQQVVYAGTSFRGSGNFAGTGGLPRPIHLLARGSVTQPGEVVEPGALACLPLRFGEGVDLASDGNRRAALARWISNPQNPLVWRSIANRVWQYHLGRGIVDTPNDFGRMGEKPTHPELLDWLAVEMRDGGQSLKKLHKLIVMSHTYRQASAPPSPPPDAPNPSSVDADNRYLWRANRRRLEAEALRDAVLSVAGKLDQTMGGPSFQDFVIEHPEHSPHYQYHLHDFDDPKSHRRSIYRFIVRSQPQPFMTTLDCADPSQRVDKRNESLSALQALATLNNGFMVTMSRHWAERISGETKNVDEQVLLAFRQALGRDPSADEQSTLAEFTRQHGIANACRLVLNLNEFAFVD